MYDLNQPIELPNNFRVVIPNPMQEMFKQMHKAIIEPFRQVIEAVQKMAEQIAETVQSILKSFRFVFTFQPIYLATPIKQMPSDNRFVEMELDNYGYFMFDGKKLDILHPASSRCGRILRILLKSKAELVNYETIRDDMGAGDLDNTFKDLKTQLRRAGYKLEYQRVQRVGIALLGVSRKY